MFSVLDKKQIEYIYNTYMIFDFPSDELKPLNLLLKMVDEGLCTYYALFDERSQVLSYFGLCVKNRFALVDYLAVNPEFRGQGIGTKTLNFLKETAKDKTILIECENIESSDNPEEREIRRRRIVFYERSGFKDSNVKARLFGVDYILLTYPQDATQVKNGYKEVYLSMLGKEMYDKHMEL